MDDDIDCDKVCVGVADCENVCVGVAVDVKPPVTVWVGETDGLDA